MKIFTDEFLKILEEKIQHSGAGIEFWFGWTDYHCSVELNKHYTFEEWVNMVVKNNL